MIVIKIACGLMLIAILFAIAPAIMTIAAGIVVAAVALFAIAAFLETNR